MGWSINPPKKNGWYLVTLTDSTVMPAYRQEYPKGCFAWRNLAFGAGVAACVKFPKPYKKEDEHE